MNLQLLERMRNISHLPSLPAVALRVLELARRDDTGVADIAKVISRDPALSAKVLRTVNSSFYGLPMQVSTINHAATLLGLQSIKTLALGFSLASSLNANRSQGFDYNRFWRQSIFAAVASRLLAKTCGSKLREEAFVAGLLSDIGSLVMHRVLGAEYDELLEATKGDQTELVRLSRKKFDLDHAQVGGMIAEFWKLPPLLTDPIRQHHALDDPSVNSKNLVEIVHVGVLCAQVFAASLTGLFGKAKEQLQARFGFGEAAIRDLFSEIDSRSGEMARAFDICIDAGRTLADIEDEAREMLMELTLRSQFQSQEVQRLNHQLQQQANTDGLTGLANRARLSHFLQCAFAHSQTHRQPLALLFMDLDRFKSVNDMLGHQAGDEVLMHLAKVLVSQVRPTDLAARYGGEEFVIVFPGMKLEVAARVAERIRQTVADAPINFDGTQIRVTISIGVAVHEPAKAGCAFASPEALIKAADTGVYAAKAAGRNAVNLQTAHSLAA